MKLKPIKAWAISVDRASAYFHQCYASANFPSDYDGYQLIIFTTREGARRWKSREGGTIVPGIFTPIESKEPQCTKKS